MSWVYGSCRVQPQVACAPSRVTESAVADHLVSDEGHGGVGLQLQELGPPLGIVQGPDLHSPGPQDDDELEGVQPTPSDADHDQGVASGEAPVQDVPAAALVRAGGSGDADVPVNVIPLDTGLAETEILAEGSIPATSSCRWRLARI